MEQNRTFSGTAVLFPLWGRSALIRDTADRLILKNGAAADRLWQQVIRRLTAELQVKGVRPNDIDDELYAFSEVVFREIRERYQGQGGGVA